MKAISIVIPVYNEAESIAQTVDELEALLSEQERYKAEIILVNDGSTDRTVQVVEEKCPNVSTIDNILNMGYGYSLKKGIENASNDTVVILDGDGSYPVDHLLSMLDRYFAGLDLVVGSRNNFFVEDSLFKSLFRGLLKFIVEFTAGTKIPDVNSGMRIFSKETIIPYFPHLSNKFSFTTSMTLHYALDSMKMEFYPNGYRKRKGRSKVNIIRDSIRTLQFIIEIIALKNPLKLHLLIMIPTGIFILISLIRAFAGNSFIPALLFLCVLFVQFSLMAIGLQRLK